MPLSRASKQKMRATSVKSAAAPEGDAREGNGVQKRSGTERPDAAQGSPGDTLDTQARVIKTND